MSGYVRGLDCCCLVCDTATAAPLAHAVGYIRPPPCSDFEPRNVYLAGYSDAILRFIAERGEGSGLVDFVNRIDDLRNLTEKEAEVDFLTGLEKRCAGASRRWRLARCG